MDPSSASVAVVICAIVSAASPAGAVDILFRSFSPSATMGPQADACAAKLATLTSTTLGAGNVVRFVKLPGLPAVPPPFHGSILAAVGAGAAHGGFDAAYR